MKDTDGGKGYSWSEAYEVFPIFSRLSVIVSLIY